MENDQDTLINFVFFLAGACIGILGGVLSGFCVTSYYRWFDFYNSQRQLHPNTFPISIDFYVFIFCTIGIFILVTLFYQKIKRMLEEIQHQQTRSINESNDKPQLIQIIEKCPICGKVYQGQSNYCELCGKEITKIENCQQEISVLSHLLKLFEDESTFFTVLASIATVISLSPLFLNVLLGQNWLSQLLGSPIGNLCLILILFSTFVGGLFTTLVLSLFTWTFILRISKTQSSRLQKGLIIFLMVLGISTIACLMLFLCMVWFAILDPIVYFYSFIYLIIDCAFFTIFLSICFYYEFTNQTSDTWFRRIILGLCCIEIILGVIIVYSLAPLAIAVHDDIGKYYTNKNYSVTFQSIEIEENNNSPSVLWLFPNIDSFQRGGTFDDYYAQCHWSSNYGHFTTINSDLSLVKTYSNELIIPKCSQIFDKVTWTNVTWTYDINDYGKSKPPVIISLRVEDPNKVVKLQQLGDLSYLGGTHVKLIWNGTDTIQREDDSKILFAKHNASNYFFPNDNLQFPSK
jgi:MFS family permease